MQRFVANVEANVSTRCGIKTIQFIDRMNSELNHELGLLTNDGWVITLVTDKLITLGDVIVKTFTEGSIPSSELLSMTSFPR
jgi:hypothetical protein